MKVFDGVLAAEITIRIWDNALKCYSPDISTDVLIDESFKWDFTYGMYKVDNVQDVIDYSNEFACGDNEVLVLVNSVSKPGL